MTEWPLNDWLRLSVHVLKISPENFWNISVRDWMQLTQSSSGGLNRDGLSDLILKFPDAVLKDKNHD